MILVFFYLSFFFPLHKGNAEVLSLQSSGALSKYPDASGMTESPVNSERSHSLLEYNRRPHISSRLPLTAASVFFRGTIGKTLKSNGTSENGLLPKQVFKIVNYLITSATNILKLTSCKNNHVEGITWLLCGDTTFIFVCWRDLPQVRAAKKIATEIPACRSIFSIWICEGLQIWSFKN